MWNCHRNQKLKRSSLEVRYKLIIRQQPIAGRACGFGERDRRSIDPPPILELLVDDPRYPGVKLPQDEDCLEYCVVHTELWSAETDIANAHIPEVGQRKQQKRLVGGLVASPFVGIDEYGVKGCFFPFPDISCRTIGRYRLKFTLVIVDPRKSGVGHKLPFRASVMSTPFEVYTAKTFPGMEESTALTRRLKAQGCQIAVKKGHQPLERKRTGSNIDEDDEGDEAKDEDAETSKGKRLKM